MSLHLITFSSLLLVGQTSSLPIPKQFEFLLHKRFNQCQPPFWLHLFHMDSIAHNSITVLPYSFNPKYIMTDQKKHSTKSYLSQTHRLLYHRHSSYCFIPTYSLLFVYMHIPNCFMKTHSIQFKKTHSIYCFKHTHFILFPCCVIQTHSLLFHTNIFTVIYSHMSYYFMVFYTMRLRKIYTT